MTLRSLLLASVASTLLLPSLGWADLISPGGTPPSHCDAVGESCRMGSQKGVCRKNASGKIRCSTNLELTHKIPTSMLEPCTKKKAGDSCSMNGQPGTCTTLDKKLACLATPKPVVIPVGEPETNAEDNADTTQKNTPPQKNSAPTPEQPAQPAAKQTTEAQPSKSGCAQASNQALHPFASMLLALGLLGLLRRRSQGKD